MSCSAMLLEDNGDQTNRFFKPGEDFAVFSSQEDLLQKVRYYLTNESERKAIARSGWEKYWSVYNAEKMWGYIFQKVINGTGNRAEG